MNGTFDGLTESPSVRRVDGMNFLISLLGDRQVGMLIGKPIVRDYHLLPITWDKAVPEPSQTVITWVEEGKITHCSTIRRMVQGPFQMPQLGVHPCEERF
jgi:hypothetical protein